MSSNEHNEEAPDFSTPDPGFGEPSSLNLPTYELYYDKEFAKKCKAASEKKEDGEKQAAQTNSLDPEKCKHIDTRVRDSVINVCTVCGKIISKMGNFVPSNVPPGSSPYTTFRMRKIFKKGIIFFFHPCSNKEKQTVLYEMLDLFHNAIPARERRRLGAENCVAAHIVWLCLKAAGRFRCRHEVADVFNESEEKMLNIEAEYFFGKLSKLPVPCLKCHNATLVPRYSPV